MKTERRLWLKTFIQKGGLYPFCHWLITTMRRWAAKIDCIRAYGNVLWLDPFPRVFYLAPFFLFDREITNFTYEIENRDELIDFLSITLVVRHEIVLQYMQELESDEAFQRQLKEKLEVRKDRNPEPKYGRRLGWYCVTRIRKPALIVETGTQDGLGAAVLTRALQRNREEGYPGMLLTFDIQPDSGWLLDQSAAENFMIIIEDTKTALAKHLQQRRVDFFIHDSNHSYDHELFELKTVTRYANEHAVLISDNAHGGNAMRDFCKAHDLRFHFFKEKPRRHFYPGGGIGLAFWLSKPNGL